MRVRVHARVSRTHPEISVTDVRTAFVGALASRARDTHPPQWLGIGVDTHGRLLQFVAIEESPDSWLVFHAMAATTKALRELGLER